MPEKRRDNKNRLLKTGESQRKDGRYAYKYTDASGKVQFVYSWRLVPTDRTPPGKKKDISLREKTAQIQRDLDDGIRPEARALTVSDIYGKYLACRPNVKRRSQQSRDRFQVLLDADPLGHMNIDRVRLSDGKEWAIRMNQKGYAVGTIKGYVTSLRAAFKVAIQDDLVRKNPFDFAVTDLIADDRKPREALTKAQQRALLDFVEHDPVYKRYYNEIVILLGTGLRISELCGLTDKDIDLEKRLINIDHQLQFTSPDGYFVDSPKTKNGVRKIPMSTDVCNAFRRVLDERDTTKKPIEIDGYKGFLFLNKEQNPMVNTRYDHIFQQIAAKYNKSHDEPLPAGITPHVLRHTFCTEMANRGMNPKTLQAIMGHSSITMTMDYYAHASVDSAQAEIDRLVG